jgi:hypothetical protein
VCWKHLLLREGFFYVISSLERVYDDIHSEACGHEGILGFFDIVACCNVTGSSALCVGLNICMFVFAKLYGTARFSGRMANTFYV